MNLVQQPKKKGLSEKQETFLTALFETNGNFNQAAEVAGYSHGSVTWLRDSLADEIVERTRALLAGNSLKAANKMIDLVDTPRRRTWGRLEATCCRSDTQQGWSG